MNIALQNISKNEHKKYESLEKISQALQKKDGNSQTENKSADNSINSDYSLEELVLNHQRTILRTQAVISGLEKIYEQMQNQQFTNQKPNTLNEIIDRTRFQDERVLARYKENLIHIVNQQDTQALETLLSEQHKLITRLSKKQTMEQNILSVNRENPFKSYEELLANVVKDIHKQMDLYHPLKRERVLDLLK